MPLASGRESRSRQKAAPPLCATEEYPAHAHPWLNGTLLYPVQGSVGPSPAGVCRALGGHECHVLLPRCRRRGSHLPKPLALAFDIPLDPWETRGRPTADSKSRETSNRSTRGGQGYDQLEASSTRKGGWGREVLQGGEGGGGIEAVNAD